MLLRYRKILGDMLCLALLTGLALVAFHAVVVGDKVPIAADSVLLLPPWEEARPAALDAPANPDADVQALRYYPDYVFLSHSAQHRDSLLWNPYDGCGRPFLATWRSRCLSPFSIPFYALPPARALQISVLLKVVVAGWCAFYAARRLGFPWPLALWVGVAFQLSGHVFLWCGWPMSDAVPWLPLLIMFAERIALGQARCWPVGALVMALMLLGGDPETVLAAVILAGLFILIRIALLRKVGEAAPLCFAALLTTVVLALGLAAIQIVPYIEFLSEAVPMTQPGSSAAVRAPDLVACFFPHFFAEDPGVLARGESFVNSQVLKLFYFGLIQVLCLPLWFSLRPFVAQAQRKRVEAMIITSAAMTIIALACAKALGGVPLLSGVHVGHFLIGNALLLALVSAAAVQEWLELDADQCRSTIFRLLAFLPALGLVALGLVLAARSEHRPGAPPFPAQAAVATGFAFAFVALMVLSLLRPSVRTTGYLLCAVTFVDLFLAFHQSIVYVEQDTLFPETTFIKALKETGARVSGSQTLARWPLAGNLISQVFTSNDPALKRHAAFTSVIEREPLLLRRTGSCALLLTKRDIQGPFVAIRPMLRIQRVFSSGAVLFEDRGAKARAWMAYEGRTIEKLDPALLGADLPPLMEGVRPPAGGNGPEANADILLPETNTRIRVRVEETRPGVLVLADTWYPDWKAAVNGTETPVFPVDGLFRGVQVGKGQHEVVLYYDPRSFKLGLGITEAAAVIVVSGLLHMLIRRSRKWRRLR